MKAATARKAPTQERARATVEALLDATAQLLVSEGFDKASTNRIAAKAGVSVGSLYQYFEGKEALVVALAERHHEELMAVLATAAINASERALADVVRDIVGAMLAAHALNPKLHRVLTEQIPRNVITCRIETDGAAFVRGLLELHCGKMRKDLDVDLASFILMHAVEGVTHAAVIERPAMLKANGGLVGANLADDLARMVTSYLQ